MTRPTNKRYLLLLVLLAIPLPAIASDSLPTAQDINDALQKAYQTCDSFFKQTFEIRMQFEYSGRFLKQEDKDKLCEAAKQASADLEQIANTQTAMKQTIEKYQGDDWETLFGQTGLWRKLSADITNTQTAKQEIDYCLARTAGSLKIEPQFFDRLAKSDFIQCPSIRASLEKIKYLGLSGPNELDDIARTLEKSYCHDNPEMLLTLALFRNKYTPDKPLKTLSGSAQAAELFGKIILADLSAGSDINSLNPLTAELAALSASQTNPSTYKKLLLSIANTNKLKTPDTLYIAGRALIESEPPKALELLIESSDLQTRQNESLLDIDARATAEYAAKLAYEDFAQKNIDCNLALAAFDNYARIASGKTSEGMQYLYGEILFGCGKIQEASEIFARLANGPHSIWQIEASLELLKIKINTDPEKALPQLHQFILNCTGKDKFKLPLRLEAMDLYCRTMLNKNNNDSSTQVLNLLDTAEQTLGLRYDLFKAQALYQSGRLEESARYMSNAISVDSNSPTALAAQIASEIVDKIELWQQDANDFNELLHNCYTLADFANKSANTYQTNLLLAEVYILEGKKITRQLPSNNETDPVWPRVAARLLMAQEKFDQSAKHWAEIAESKQNESGRQNQKSYGWWQAKFYELDCLVKATQADKQNIAHAIDVLLGTYPQIPPPWPEKLDLLKNQCLTN